MSKRTKRSVPPFMIRRVMLFCGLMVFLGLLGFFGLMPLFRGSTPWGLALQACRILIMVGAMIWFVVGLRKLHKTVREMDGLVCWECGYCLHGLAEAGTCPECGSGYTVDELRRRWTPEPPG